MKEGASYRPGGMLPRKIVALGAALASAAAYAVVASEEPATALYAFFVAPFASGYAFLSLVERAAPVLACAIGACVSFKAGIFNLGGEGQAAAGALAAALAARAIGEAPVPPAFGIAAAVAAAMAAGAALALVSALAEEWSGADIMLTSFLLSQAAVIAADWTIGSALRDEGSNLLAMAKIPDGLRLPRLAPPSPLSAAAPLAVAAALAVLAWLRTTRGGKELEIVGSNRDFARAVGIATRSRSRAMTVSGALGGLAGGFLVLGQAGRAIKGMTGGIGWDGLSVALVAGSDPLAAIPAAAFFSWLDAGARQASLVADLSPDASAIMKAAALFLVTATAIGGARVLRLRRGSRGRVDQAQGEGRASRA